MWMWGEELFRAGTRIDTDRMIDTTISNRASGAGVIDSLIVRIARPSILSRKAS